ncbi:MAG: TetR/AcrR family transcriptional regulator [Betaproteobacteria bacterium]|nr:TetR/AcrR family transcriptional regulator [Betaproteobacteria bacterium]
MQAADTAPAVSRGGRPSREAAAQLGERILDAAMELMLEQGYGATSIEAVAARAGVSKRTFYHRFADKAALVQAVVARVVERARPPLAARPSTPGRDAAPAPEGLEGLRRSLHEFGSHTLRAALSPQVLALYRLIIGESHRFPDLLRAVALSGGRAQAVRTLVDTMCRQLPQLPPAQAEFAAQQFLQMLVSLPQLRAMGIGDAMSEPECELWVSQTVDLLLDGLHHQVGGSRGECLASNA